MNEAQVLELLQAIAFADYTDYVWIEDGEVRIRDSRELSANQRAAIAGIKDTGKGVELKLHDKQKALELLVKLLGLFSQSEEDAVCVRFEGDAEELSK